MKAVAQNKGTDRQKPAKTEEHSNTIDPVEDEIVMVMFPIGTWREVCAIASSEENETPSGIVSKAIAMYAESKQG